jgi:hypothetical protein
MMGRHRWMYYATGLPGWMRFGFSPGWLGRSPMGLGPCATYMLTGTWGTPQAQAYWDAMNSGAATAPWPGFMPSRGMSPEDELDFLKEHANALADQIESVNKRIAEIETESKKMAGGEAK